MYGVTEKSMYKQNSSWHGRPAFEIRVRVCGVKELTVHMHCMALCNYKFFK